MAGTLDKLHQAILNGDDELAEELTRKALDEGHQPETIFKQVLGPTLQEVGRLWKAGKFYMPEAVVSIDTFQIAKAVIEASQGKKAGKYYFYYTSCPKCAKKYGHNYIVAFAEV